MDGEVSWGDELPWEFPAEEPCMRSIICWYVSPPLPEASALVEYAELDTPDILAISIACTTESSSSATTSTAITMFVFIFNILRPFLCRCRQNCPSLCRGTCLMRDLCNSGQSPSAARCWLFVLLVPGRKAFSICPILPVSGRP